VSRLEGLAGREANLVLPYLVSFDVALNGNAHET
jgi:hypothetical protein